MKHLARYIKSYLSLNESFETSDSQRLSIVIEKINSFISANIDLPSSHQYAYLDNLMSDMNIHELASGSSRTAYSNPEDFYVIKIAQNEIGVEAIESEIEISNNDHSQPTQNIFLDVYDYDKINKKPLWLACEKVTPLEEVDNISKLKKIFPTFDRITNSLIKDSNTFTSFVVYILSAPYLNLEEKDEDILYHFKAATKKFWTFVENRDSGLLELDDITIGNDIHKFSQAFTHIHTSDLDKGNIGIKTSSNPSPNDIVILDFEYSYNKKTLQEKNYVDKHTS